MHRYINRILQFKKFHLIPITILVTRPDWYEPIPTLLEEFFGLLIKTCKLSDLWGLKGTVLNQLILLAQYKVHKKFTTRIHYLKTLYSNNT